MEPKDIEMRLERQIARLERLKEEIESTAHASNFKGCDWERSFVDLIDRESMETYAKEYEKFKHIIHKRGFGLNNRRSEMEIVANILDIAIQGVNKTKILYKANLSYVQLKNYVDFLLEKGLLERIGNTYSTTKKGTVFLITWQNTLMLLR